jgi:acetolactate synthase I/II/III large subunit
MELQAVHYGVTAAIELPPTPRILFRPDDSTATYSKHAMTLGDEGRGAVDLATVGAQLRDVLPDDAIVTNGAGNYTISVHRFFEYRRFRTQLAPQSGAMGYCIPAALAAALVPPHRVVVAFAGDGCFQMSGHELATAVEERVPIIVLVANHRMLATIRMHQERRFPGRVIGTDLVNPDFVSLGEAYGAYAERVEHTNDFLAAFERARTARRPALIELVTDPDALTPRASLSHMRAQESGVAG